MTCIVALKDPARGVTIMGGDSQRTLNDLAVTLPYDDSKVFIKSGLVIGHTGASKVRNLTSRLEINFQDGPSKDFDLEEEIVTAIIPAIKKLAKKGDWLQEEKGLADLGGSILIAIGLQICLISNDFAVTPISTGFWAIGSGTRVALGSLATSEALDWSPEKRVLKALEAAAMFETSVGPPFIIKESNPLN